MNRIFTGLLVSCLLLSIIPVAKADTQDACSIWLCLPSGFPTGCASAYSEFKHRIKTGKPPLPGLSSCVTGPDGSKSKGTYKTGVEYFMPCKDGFQYNKIPQGFYDEIMCLPVDPQCSVREKYRSNKKIDCTPYPPIRRDKQRYIRVWLDDKYIGQFFY